MMMKIFVVYPSAHAGWALLREGEPDSLHFRDRDAAVTYGRCLAHANRPSTLRIEAPHGGLEGAWLFEAAGTVRPLPSGG